MNKIGQLLEGVDLAFHNPEDDLETDVMQREMHEGAVNSNKSNKCKSGRVPVEKMKAYYESQISKLQEKNDELNEKKEQLAKNMDEKITNLGDNQQKKESVFSKTTRKLNDIDNKIKENEGKIDFYSEQLKSMEEPSISDPTLVTENEEEKLNSEMNLVSGDLATDVNTIVKENMVNAELNDVSDTMASEISQMTDDTQGYSNLDEEQVQKSETEKMEPQNTETVEIDPHEAEIQNVLKKLEENIQNSTKSYVDNVQSLMTSSYQEALRCTKEYYQKTTSKIIDQAQLSVKSAGDKLKKSEEKFKLSEANLRVAEDKNTNLENELSEKNETINSLNEQLNTKEKENSSLKAENKKLMSQVQSLTNIVNSFQSLSLLESDDNTLSEGKSK